MPKGHKTKEAPPPPHLVRCDFCPNKFRPAHWNSRTCASCRKAGAPDQAETINYDKVLDAYLKKNGRRIRRCRTSRRK